MPEVIYKCLGCQYPHRTMEQAQECENQSTRAFGGDIKVGDIVTANTGYQWFDGDSRWISNYTEDQPRRKKRLPCPTDPSDTNCHIGCCGYNMYFVVTAIAVKDHKFIYHCVTKALGPSYSGWTSVVDGRKLTKVENPPEFVVEDSKDLIGVFCEGTL